MAARYGDMVGALLETHSGDDNDGCSVVMYSWWIIGASCISGWCCGAAGQAAKR